MTACDPPQVHPEARGVRPERPVRAAGVLVWTGDADDPRFLLLQNARHGTWGFAKGHLEEGESELDGALRELAEETGLRLDAEDLVPEWNDAALYRTPNGAWKRVVLYLAAQPTPTEALERSDEHARHAWATVGEALERLEHEDLRRALVRAATRLRPARP